MNRNGDAVPDFRRLVRGCRVVVMTPICVVSVLQAVLRNAGGSSLLDKAILALIGGAFSIPMILLFGWAIAKGFWSLGIAGAPKLPGDED